MVLVLAAASATGCHRASAEGKDAGAEPSPVRVQSATVTDVVVPSTLRLAGSLKGERESDLAANANGRVLTTSVERGAEVTPGQVLAKLDVRAAALSAAEARVQAENTRVQQATAQKECERYETLRQKGAVSDLEYDRAVAQCRTLPLSAQAAGVRAQLAAQNVGDGVIRAPFAGVVTERYVEVGQYVRQDSRVVTIVSNDPLRLELAVPEASVGDVRAGAAVTFHVAAYPTRTFTGTVRFVSGALRPATRDLVVEAAVANTDRALKPGMFADVEIVTGSRKLPGIPRSAVVMKDGQARAFFVAGGRLEERLVSLGPEVGTSVGIERGAASGDVVVTQDVGALLNGQRVR
jgi:membrane fusion protein, multidrug efflux system